MSDRPLVNWFEGVWVAASFVSWAIFLWWQGTLGPAIVWNDSTAYEQMAGHPVLSAGFLEGQKGPLAAGLWKLTGNPGAFVAAQTAIYIICFGVLAWTLYHVVSQQRWVRVVCWCAGLGFGTVTAMMEWNRSVLSESLAGSSIALLFSALLWLAHGFTWRRAGFVVIAGALGVVSRYTQITTTGLLGIAIALWAGYSSPRRTADARRSSRGRIVASLLVVVAMASLYSEEASGVGASNISDVFSVRVFPFPARDAWMAAHGMPEGRMIEAAARSLVKPTTGVATLSIGQSDVSAWVAEHGTAMYAIFLVEHPWLIVSEPFVRPELATNFFGGNISAYGGLNRTNAVDTGVLWPSAWWSGALLAVEWWWLVVRSNKRGIAVRKMSLAMGAMVVIGVLTMAVAWHTGSQETTRHTLGGLSEVHLGMVMLGLLMLGDAAESQWRVRWWRERQGDGEFGVTVLGSEGDGEEKGLYGLS